jgi:3-isopropylmalate/(R)-2-methylmalate dehydratase small subunit
MRAFRSVRGRMLPLDRADVDTDQIIPKQFLKRIERSGYGPFLFHDWRRDPSFVLNLPQHAGASILVAGPNFGCGSSREHAAWALEDAGFRAVIAPSFGDIFRNNSTKVGLLPVELGEAQVRHLLDLALEAPESEVEVDLEARAVRVPGAEYRFEIDDFTRTCLLEGLDDIGLSLRHEDAIGAFEGARPAWLPSVGS